MPMLTVAISVTSVTKVPVDSTSIQLMRNADCQVVKLQSLDLSKYLPKVAQLIG